MSRRVGAHARWKIDIAACAVEKLVARHARVESGVWRLAIGARQPGAGETGADNRHLTEQNAGHWENFIEMTKFSQPHF